MLGYSKVVSNGESLFKAFSRGKWKRRIRADTASDADSDAVSDSDSTSEG